MILKWAAYYEDGTVIREGDNNIRSPLKLPRKGATKIALHTPEGAVKAEVNLADGQVFFYRCHGTVSSRGFLGYRYAIGYRTKTSLYFKEVDEQGNVAERTQFEPRFESPWFPEEQP